MQKLILPILLASIICGGFIASDTKQGLESQTQRQESELFDDNYQIIVRSNPIFPETEVLGTHHDSYYSLLARYDWDANLMYRIMKCESGFNPRAYNPEWHRGCQGSFGLLQVACVHRYTGLSDPEKNIQAAYEIWQKQSYWAWANCYKASR